MKLFYPTIFFPSRSCNVDGLLSPILPDIRIDLYVSYRFERWVFYYHQLVVILDSLFRDKQLPHHYMELHNYYFLHLTQHAHYLSILISCIWDIWDFSSKAWNLTLRVSPPTQNKWSKTYQEMLIPLIIFTKLHHHWTYKFKIVAEILECIE